MYKVVMYIFFGQTAYERKKQIRRVCSVPMAPYPYAEFKVSLSSAMSRRRLDDNYGKGTVGESRTLRACSAVLPCSRRRIRVVVQRKVDSHLKPHEQATRQVISELDVLREGVVVGRGTVARELILRIGSPRDSVFVVGRRLLDAVDK